MTYVPPPINEFAQKAGNASRLLGILMILCGILVVVIVGSIMPRNSPSWAKLLMYGIGGFYLAFGVVFFAFGAPLKSGARGLTLVTLILAILSAVLFGLSFTGNLIQSATNPNVLALGISGLFTAIAALLAFYCGKSLAFIRQWDAPRGFTPVMHSHTAAPLVSPSDAKPEPGPSPTTPTVPTPPPYRRR